jgi:hypothetical protein
MTPSEARVLMAILDNIVLAASCAAASILLYKTDFLVEYGKIFRFISFEKDIEYKCFKIQNNGKANFLDFLQSKNNNFFTRLISCPFCLGFWMCLIVTKIQFLLFVYFVYVILYKATDIMFNHGTRN